MDIFYPIQFLADKISLNPVVNFFIYDTIKIGVLLLVINYFMAVTRYYFPINKAKNFLASRRWYGLDYLLAALFGVVTPFCSCSSVPLFIGFLSAGIPLGVTFSFLIASPLVNESSLILFPALFGFKTTVIYNLAGIIIAIIGGIIIEKLHLEKYVNPDLLKHPVILKSHQKTRKQLLFLWWQDAIKITKSIFPYVVLGVAVGAIIHGLIPDAFFEKYLSSRAWWAVPLATLLGAPFYANSVSVIPIIEASVGRGIPLGTALAFMTAIVTLSIPEALILKKAMKWQLLITFFGITIAGIIFIGYLFNYLS
jgi:uncharacterized membrane protein YraQ (UPF0718 family)